MALVYGGIKKQTDIIWQNQEFLLVPLFMILGR